MREGQSSGYTFPSILIVLFPSWGPSWPWPFLAIWKKKGWERAFFFSFPTGLVEAGFFCIFCLFPGPWMLRGGFLDFHPLVTLFGILSIPGPAQRPRSNTTLGVPHAFPFFGGAVRATPPPPKFLLALCSHILLFYFRSRQRLVFLASRGSFFFAVTLFFQVMLRRFVF